MESLTAPGPWDAASMQAEYERSHAPRPPFPQPDGLQPRDCTACAYCGGVESIAGGRANRKCAQCASVAYCSKECQRKHWKAGHKAVCKVLAANRRSGSAGGGGSTGSAGSAGSGGGATAQATAADRRPDRQALANLAVAATQSEETVRRQLFLEVNSPQRKNGRAVDSPGAARWRAGSPPSLAETQRLRGIPWPGKNAKTGAAARRFHIALLLDQC